MSIFQMSILTFLICLGTAGYAWCNWTENRCLNDVKQEQKQEVYIKICSYCGGMYLSGTACFNDDCPLNKK